MLKTIGTTILFAMLSASLSHAQAAPLHIGFIGPLSGPVASMGESARRAMQLVPADIATISYQDDQCSGAKAVAAYQLLKSQGVRVFQMLCSGSILAVAPLAKASGDLILTGYAGSSEIRKSGLETIRFNSDSISMAEAMVKHLAEQPPAKYGILYEEQDYAVSMAERLKEKLGAQIITSEQYRATDSTFRTTISKLRNAGIENLLFIPTSDRAAEIIYREMQQLHFKIPLIGEDNVCDYAIRPSQFGLHGFCFKAKLPEPVLNQFLQRYRTKHGSASQYPVYDILTYDSIIVAGRTYREMIKNRPSPPTPTEIAAEIIKGGSGEMLAYRFDQSGEVVPNELFEAQSF